jgi:GT2 family glycosyltransferase
VRVEPQTLDTLVRISKSQDAALVGPQVFDVSGSRALFSGKTWPGLLFGSGFISGSTQNGESWDSAYAEGCAFLLRNDLIDKRIQEYGQVLDQHLFMYCEDTDLGLYAHSRAFKCRIARDAHVRHGHAKSHGGDGNPFSHYYITRNRIQLAKNWLPWGWRILFHFYYAPSRLLLWLSRIGRRRLGSWEAGRAAFAGVWDGYFNRLGRWKRD